MKNRIKFLTVLIVCSFIFTSCDEDDLKSFADITVESSLTENYNLNFNAESEEAIEESMTINLADDTTISEYLNQLEKIKITKITYEITSFTGDHYVDMNVGFYMDENAIVIPKEYNLYNETGVEYEITDASILETISTTLLSNKEVTFKLKGDYQSLSPAAAEITVTIYFKLTANPL